MARWLIASLLFTCPAQANENETLSYDTLPEHAINGDRVSATGGGLNGSALVREAIVLVD